MKEASEFNEQSCIKQIGWVSSFYTKKFGVPRQSGVIEESIGSIHFFPEFGHENSLRGLDQFSHIWVIFSFHQAVQQGWSDLVRPPELGGNDKVGVYASRSPFRPNHLGLSVFKLSRIYKHEEHGWSLRVSGVDVIHGTPVYDVKPYIPYADAVPDAEASYAKEPKDMEVQVSCKVPKGIPNDVFDCLVATIRRDPRPQYQCDSSRVYGVTLAGWNAKWTVRESDQRNHHACENLSTECADIIEITPACE